MRQLWHIGPRRRKKRGWLLALLALLLLAELYSSNCRLSVEAYTIPLANLPTAFDGLRAVQLTDLHGAEFGRDNRHLLQAVREAAPDLIFLTGDLLDRGRETTQEYAVELTAALADIAPTYFVTGNHEWALPETPALKRRLAEAGAVVLDNRFTVLERAGESLVLAGIDDPNGYADQKTPETLAAEVRAACPGTCWLLLAHRNDRFREQYSCLGADLVLSGHGHGGLIRLPFTDGLFSTDRRLFPDCTDGLYYENGAVLFVSRGLGNSGRTFRFFNRPQVAVITFVRAS